MKRMLGVLGWVAAVLLLAWMSLEYGEGTLSSSYAAPPETPASAQTLGSSFTYNFDGDAVGAVPAKFHKARTGQGSESKWEVMVDPSAPSKPNVVAQTSSDKTDYRFPLRIADEGTFKDLEPSVGFKAVSDNYRLYHVINRVGASSREPISKWRPANGMSCAWRLWATSSFATTTEQRRSKPRPTRSRPQAESACGPKVDWVTYFGGLRVTAK